VGKEQKCHYLKRFYYSPPPKAGGKEGILTILRSGQISSIFGKIQNKNTREVSVGGSLNTGSKISLHTFILKKLTIDIKSTGI
jgi:hypothetical protein